MSSLVRGWRFTKGRNLVCFVGDVHGHLDKLECLWDKIPREVGGEDAFEQMQVVFLGDYCDKGPDTRGVVEWMTTLGDRHPEQAHHFLCGNHDFALSSFLGLLPERQSSVDESDERFVPPNQADYSETWRKQDKASEFPNEGAFYTGPGHERMHLQGVRYGATPSSVFTSDTTFRSYGVEYGDRQGLLDAMPLSHLKFFADLSWIVKLRSHIGDIVGVHAGLEDENPAELDRTVQMLNNRDPCFLHEAFIEPLCGRANVERMPYALQPSILKKRGYTPPPLFLVSGHHGFVRINGRRIIVDMCRGQDENDLACFVMHREGQGHSHTQISSDSGLSMKIITSA